VRTVVFDLAGVVCRFTPERRLAALAAHSGLTGATVHARLFESGLDDRAEAGEISPAETYRLVVEALHGTIDTVELRRRWSLAFDPDPDVLVLVDAVPGPVAMLTNNGAISRDVLTEQLRAVGARFDPLLCSCTLGARKPDPAVFHAAARAIGAEPAELLMVDDAAANVAGARAAGWHAHRHTEDDLDGLRRVLDRWNRGDEP
jgi:putative hydrolase of the HAD superfamily